MQNKNGVPLKQTDQYPAALGVGRAVVAGAGWRCFLSSDIFLGVVQQGANCKPKSISGESPHFDDIPTRATVELTNVPEKGHVSFLARPRPRRILLLEVYEGHLQTAGELGEHFVGVTVADRPRDAVLLHGDDAIEA